MADALEALGIATGPIEDLTGLWVDDDRNSRLDFTGADAAYAAPGLARGSIRKIGSIGLKIRRGITSHGLSLNVSCDLEPFEWINSCGIEACRATSIVSESGGEAPSVDSVGEAVAASLASRLHLEPASGNPADIRLAEAHPANSVA